jgi:hypothetical protein
MGLTLKLQEVTRQRIDAEPAAARKSSLRRTQSQLRFRFARRRTKVQVQEKRPQRQNLR